MTISGLDDLSAEAVHALREKAALEREFKKKARRKYQDRSDGFFNGYMAYATGFRPDNGALYYEAMPEMAMGWLCAQRDIAEVS
jgi:hypothetical protein